MPNSGNPSEYCFVEFKAEEEAIQAIMKLNGKVIPNTDPAVTFKLDITLEEGNCDFTLWVGDLNPKVDDYTLYTCFAAKYPSIKSAIVPRNDVGKSKGFGFLRFDSQDALKHCLAHMNGYEGLGSNPLVLAPAKPRHQRRPNTNDPPMYQQSGGYQYPPDYSFDEYWQPYWQRIGIEYDPYTGDSLCDPQQYGPYPPSSEQYPQYSYYTPQASAVPSLTPADDFSEQYGQYPPSSEQYPYYTPQASAVPSLTPADDFSEQYGQYPPSSDQYPYYTPQASAVPSLTPADDFSEQCGQYPPSSDQYPYYTPQASAVPSLTPADDFSEQCGQYPPSSDQYPYYTPQASAVPSLTPANEVVGVVVFAIPFFTLLQ